MTSDKMIPLYPSNEQTAAMNVWAATAVQAKVDATDGMTKETAALVGLRGWELGMGLGHALDSLHVIKGRISMSAELMRDRANAAGYYIDIVSEGEDHCTVVIYHCDNPERKHEEAFLMEDAKRAGLVRDGSTWVKSPKDMMRAAASRKAVRWFAPQVLAGCLERQEAEELPAPRVLDASEVEDAEQAGRDFANAHKTLGRDKADEINGELTRIIREADLSHEAKTKISKQFHEWKLKTFGVEEMHLIRASDENEADLRRWVRRLGEKLAVQAAAPPPPDAIDVDFEEVEEAEAEPAPAADETEPSPDADDARLPPERWSEVALPALELTQWWAALGITEEQRAAIHAAADVQTASIAQTTVEQRFRLCQMTVKDCDVNDAGIYTYFGPDPEPDVDENGQTATG